jgi:hypothetical protein
VTTVFPSLSWGDGEAVSQCFTENAVVKDEGHTHKGRVAIKVSPSVIFAGERLKLFKPRLAGQIPFGPIIDGLAANENIGLSCRVAYSKDFRELLEGKAQATPIWPWHGRPV